MPVAMMIPRLLVLLPCLVGASTYVRDPNIEYVADRNDFLVDKPNAVRLKESAAAIVLF